MDVSVVLDLDLSQLRSLVRLGAQHQREQQSRQGSTGGAGEPIRVPGMGQPMAGPGSAQMPLTKGGMAGAGAGAIAMVAIIAEKIVESVMDFGKKILQGSKLLNLYFGAMGKAFSAAIDVLLIPFTPLLNLLLAGLMKFVVWLAKPSVFAAISAGIEKVGEMGRALFTWAVNAWGFFNSSLDPHNWDWAGLLSATVTVFGQAARWIGNAIRTITSSDSFQAALKKTAKAGSRALSNLTGDALSTLTIGLLDREKARSITGGVEGWLWDNAYSPPDRMWNQENRKRLEFLTGITNARKPDRVRGGGGGGGGGGGPRVGNLQQTITTPDSRLAAQMAYDAYLQAGKPGVTSGQLPVHFGGGQ